jgi:hypothetical protein
MSAHYRRLESDRRPAECRSSLISNRKAYIRYANRGGVMRKILIASGATVLSMLGAAPGQTASFSYGSGATAARILAAHNRERMRLGIAPLQWDPALAAAAASYGPTLARLGRLQHSPGADRRSQRENLWMGTRGAFSPEQMVGGWLAERAYFRSGQTFPYVSRTGKWADVAHYTQVVWRSTTRVGCAIYPSRRWDFLICRYSPPGNIDGRPVA